jgi:hypothetical protein
LEGIRFPDRPARIFTVMKTQVLVVGIIYLNL